MLQLFSRSAPEPVPSEKHHDAKMASGSRSSTGTSLVQAGIIDVFNDNLRNHWTLTNCYGEQYVDGKRLVAWMEQCDHGSATNGGLLLDDAYSSGTLRTRWPTISKEKRHIVFAILLSGGHGHHIQSFIRHDIRDNNILDSDARRMLAHGNAEPGLPEAVDFFEQQKWKFCPVQISLNFDRDLLRGKHILPFCRRERINGKGATAQLYVVAVQEAFVRVDLQEALEGSRFPDQENQSCYQFAVKSFSRDNKAIFESETENFNVVSHLPGMVKCLGKYKINTTNDDNNTIDDDDNVASHHIMLEFGQFDLEEYMRLHHSPTLGKEIIDFWTELSRIADALEQMHNLKQIKHDGNSIPYNGWHADVKLDNILRVGDKYKLADLGFAKFERPRVRKHPLEEAKTLLDGATDTYGAPEVRQALTNQQGALSTVSQTIDTWSFGCVLSVVVTWVVLGAQGTQVYQDVRRTAIKKLGAGSQQEHQSWEGTCDDAFHDGVDVLEDVKEWHQFLRRQIRRSDLVSDRIMDLIEEGMLVADPSQRLSSKALCGRLQIILQKATEDLTRSEADRGYGPIAGNVLECLLALDENAPATAEDREQVEEAQRSRRTPQDDSKQAAKSVRLANFIPSKVAHRRVLGPAKSQRSFKSTVYPPSLSTSDLIAPETIYEEPQEAPKMSTSLQGHNYTFHATGSTPTANLSPSKSPSQSQSPISPKSEEKFFLSMESPAGPSRASQRTSMQDLSPTTPTNAPRAADNRPFLRKLSSRLSPRSSKLQKNDYLSKFIKDRDITFVVDNGSSMRRFWADAEKTLDMLAQMVIPFDEDGIDLIFPFGEHLRNVKKNTTKLMDAMRRFAPPSDPGYVLPTDMAKTLGSLFEEYRRRPRCDATLIVLTDGVWEGLSTPTDVEDKIVAFMKDPKISGSLQDRQFSIEFVSFGQDGIERLNDLDDGMANKYEIPDVIDHEPSSGDPYKMILGSVYGIFDQQMPEHSTSTPITPTPETSSPAPFPPQRGLSEKLKGRFGRR
ncbi:hypothetical protein F4780DRAFT_776381 [Xylariomycetidae sp. FL0641]|nr:hypothetical protein F4780DRAFT_776381 [Xylariomycetidae sp. FL0641]